MLIGATREAGVAAPGARWLGRTGVEGAAQRRGGGAAQAVQHVCRRNAAGGAASAPPAAAARAARACGAIYSRATLLTSLGTQPGARVNRRHGAPRPQAGLTSRPPRSWKRSRSAGAHEPRCTQLRGGAAAQRRARAATSAACVRRAAPRRAAAAAARAAPPRGRVAAEARAGAAAAASRARGRAADAAGRVVICCPPFGARAPLHSPALQGAAGVVRKWLRRLRRRRGAPLPPLQELRSPNDSLIVTPPSTGACAVGGCRHSAARCDGGARCDSAVPQLQLRRRLRRNRRAAAAARRRCNCPVDAGADAAAARARGLRTHRVGTKQRCLALL